VHRPPSRCAHCHAVALRFTVFQGRHRGTAPPLPPATPASLPPGRGARLGRLPQHRAGTVLLRIRHVLAAVLRATAAAGLCPEFHIGAASASLALSLSTGFLAVSILLAGMVSERFGRKELMFASLATAACCNLLAGIAPSWHLILVARALEGMALGGVPAVAMAYLAEEIDAGGLGYAMGLYVGGNAFGGMVGRVAMSTLAEAFGWRHAMLAIGALDLVLAVAFVMMLPASRNFVRNGTLRCAITSACGAATSAMPACR
jgi:predicted MFS family arabinose efflux permease